MLYALVPETRGDKLKTLNQKLDVNSKTRLGWLSCELCENCRFLDVMYRVLYIQFVEAVYYVLYTVS